ncbi:hypothetical protein CSC67_07875 [Pusillimonas caeni]|uniref:hypothetical protein n=1 Tax=Pusillimonas caeni TaxID=1348472 RepID=UPI000E59A55E|nr:hypothetical protein [Pusillimonas caeni]TFL14076.1 hypothetical protein CSC67_07875 [Pusillimonas caeni]
MLKQFDSPPRAYRHHLKVLHICAVLLCACALLMTPAVGLAQSLGGLEQGTSVLERFREWLWLIIPILCTIAGLVMGAFYSADVIRKDTLIQWGGGVFFAGVLVGAIIKLFFT